MIKFIRLILKQRKVGNFYGNFMQVAQQLGLVSQIISLCLLIVTTASVLQDRGIQVPVWLLGLLVIGIICVAALLVFTLGVPSYFGAFNEQMYKHNNPMRKDIEKIMDKLGIEREKDDRD
jgi:hypothetical protein